MIRILLVILLSAALTGCISTGRGTVPTFGSAATDARILTSVSTVIDRSAVPHHNRIHTYDAFVRFSVGRYDPQTRRLVTSATELNSDYTQFLSRSDFNGFRLAWSEVASGLYTITRVYQDSPVSLALTCTTNDGALLPGVIPVPVNSGDFVYFGHVTITLKVDPAIDGGVTHPARLAAIHFEDRPAVLDAELRQAGIDPASVRFIRNVDGGCKTGLVKRSFGRY